MKNKFLLLALLLFCSLSAFAQIQVEQGKLILTDGREIDGKISYYYDNPTVVNIYDAADNKQTFAPKHVKEIKLAKGTRFVSMEFNATPTIFQVLVLSNKISLYKREAVDLEFYASKDSTIHKLENNEVTIAGANGKRFKKFDYKYVGTLTTLMQDRADLIDDIQKANFNENALVSLITSYNNGDILYNHSESKIKTEKTAYWVAYAHFSNHATFQSDVTTGPSKGYQIGAQYYFSNTSRNSFRIGIDFSTYEIVEKEREYYWDKTTTWINENKTLTVKYQYDFIQQEKIKVYLLMHLFELGHRTEKLKDSNYDVSGFSIWPRLSPAAGFEFKAYNSFSVFAEANNLLMFKHVPKSFSVGAKYSFRK